MELIRNIIRDRKVRRDILSVVLVLAAVRMLYSVPVPGLISGAATGGQATLADILAGGTISSSSVMMLNIMPYITASIMMQLLGNMVPALARMQRGRSDGQKRYEDITMALSVALAAAGAASVAAGYARSGLFAGEEWYYPAMAAASCTAGSAVCCIAGRAIQDRHGVSGTSLILFLNIVSSYPEGIRDLFATFTGDGSGLEKVLGTFSFTVLATAFVILLFSVSWFMQEAGHEVRVIYSGRSCLMGNESCDFLVIRFWPGGVTPVIFASSMMSLASLAASAFTGGSAGWAAMLDQSGWFCPSDWLPTAGAAVFALLIFLFSLYHVTFTSDPEETADRLRRQGAVIEGVRPGTETARYLKRKTRKMAMSGAAVLAAMALLPAAVSGLTGMTSAAFMGTSVVITTSIAAEVMAKLRAASCRGMYLCREGLF